MFPLTKKRIRLRMEENLSAAFCPHGRLKKKTSAAPSEMKIVDVTPLYTLQDEKELVSRSFQTILGRYPDREEMETWENMLRQDVPEALLIYLMTISREAQERNSEYSGLISPCPLREVQSFEGVRFIRNAYKSILWREPDLEGLIAHLSMLCSGNDGISVLCAIAQSDEAKKLPYVLPGIEALLAEEGKTIRKIARKVKKAIRRITGKASPKRNFLTYLISGAVDLVEIYENSISSLKRNAWQGWIATKVDEVIAAGKAAEEGIKAAVGEAREKSAAHIDALVGERLLDQEKRYSEQQGWIATKVDEVIAAGKAAEEGIKAAVGEAREKSAAHIDALVGERLLDQEKRYSEQQGWIATKVDEVIAAGKAEAEKVREKVGLTILRSQENIRSSMRPPIIQSSNLMMTRIHGFVMGVPADDWRLAAHLTFYGPYEKGSIQAFRKRIRKGMVVVDIGANIGIYSLIAGSLVGESGRVFSFEPAPETYDILNKNIMLNDMGRRIETFPHALADKPGKAKFGIFSTCGHNSLYFGTEAKAVIDVEKSTLDMCLEDVAKVDAVKIDAEGAEPKILQGMTRILGENEDILLFIEFAPSLLLRAGIRPADFLDAIQSLGFKWHAIQEDSGESLSVSRKELIDCFSCNLLLERG